MELALSPTVFGFNPRAETLLGNNCPFYTRAVTLLGNLPFCKICPLVLGFLRKIALLPKRVTALCPFISKAAVLLLLQVQNIYQIIFKVLVQLSSSSLVLAQLNQLALQKDESGELIFFLPTPYSPEI